MVVYLYNYGEEITYVYESLMLEIPQFGYGAGSGII